MLCRTALTYYRPSSAPAISGESLASFVERFSALGVADSANGILCEVMYGQPVDANYRPASWVQEKSPGVGVRKTLPWDVQERCLSPKAVRNILSRDAGEIYRARIDLGAVSREIKQAAKRCSKEAMLPLAVQRWVLDIGPIEVRSLVSDGAYYVGWIGLHLTGRGCLYPLSVADWVRSAGEMPKLRAVEALCREMWPLAEQLPARRVERLRDWMGPLFPDEDHLASVSWCWGIHEDGAEAVRENARRHAAEVFDR